jgi:TolB-like protein/DNA-binding winged helix-turn-helix (wHTH) protein
MHAAVNARRVRFAAYEADLCTAELFKHGIRIKIQDQPFDILAMLLERPGRIVSREELRVRLWAKNTFVDFDAGLNAAVRRLRDVLDDSAEQPRYIETIPRRGYRFIAPVETVGAAKTEKEASTEKVETHAGTAAARKRVLVDRARLLGKLLWAVAAVVASVLLAVVLESWRSRFFSANASSKIRSIAVCPLKNLTGDPQRDFFVEGMTEALVTELTHVRSLKVTSGPSYAQLKATNQRLREILRRLSVDALLEGSVLQSGPRVRIAVRLIEVPSERCLWAKGYDRDEGDILNLESEVARM